MQRKEPFFRPTVNAASTLQEYLETLARLRSLTDDLERQPLHAGATAAIRHCLALMELCLSTPAQGGGQEALASMAHAMDAMQAQAAAEPDPAARTAAIAAGLTGLIKERRRA